MKEIVMTTIYRAFCVALAVLWGVHSSQAAEVTLRFHQFLPLTSTIPAEAIEPWIEAVERDSGGRIKVEHYPSMQLGGKPPSLYGQARDGVVDIIWTVLGYTPGLFPTAEAFELPFMTGDAESGSVAFHQFMMENGQNDFKDVHPLAFHIHGPGIIHIKGDAVRSIDDLQGKKLRGPTRVTTMMLKELGATAIGMPVPAVPESLSKGVIDGAVIPYEVSVILKMSELTDGHTGFESSPGLYTATFGILMNKARYEGLPDDLKAIIDQHSGVTLARVAGQAMDRADEVGIKIARDAGNEVVVLDDAQKTKWIDAAQPVFAAWVAEMDAKSIDGAELLAKARAEIAKAK